MKKALTELEQETLTYLKANPFKTYKEMGEEMGIPEVTLQKRVITLEGKGHIKRQNKPRKSIIFLEDENAS